MKLLHTLLMLIILGAVLFVAPQHAHASSNGCNSMVNLNGTLVWNEQKTTGNQDFWAGDMVTLYLQTWDANGKVTVRIYGPNGDTFFTTFPATYTYKFDQAGSATFNVANLETGDRTRITVTATCNGYSALPLFTDGRINMDADQTAAIYCYRGGVNVSRIILSKGYPSLRVSAATIAKTPKYPAHNTLIAEDKRYKVRLYRLSSGELQINATSYEGKPDYVFIWNGCETS
jgi:hypothetical protein